MSAAEVATPSSARSAASFGDACSLKTTKPMSTPCVRRRSVTSTVWAWPPKWSAASNSETRALSARPRAAARPAIPEPTTAIRFIGAARHRRCARQGRGTEARRRMSPSAPGGTREEGGRRRCPRGFQPAAPAGSATETGSSMPPPPSATRQGPGHGAAAAAPRISLTRTGRASSLRPAKAGRETPMSHPGLLPSPGARRLSDAHPDAFAVTLPPAAAPGKAGASAARAPVMEVSD